MKKTLLLLSGMMLGTILSTTSNAQVITEGFEDITTLTAAGWVQTNLSSPLGTVGWTQGSVTSPFPARTGNGFIVTNYQNGAGASTLSNWLMTPNLTLNNGDVITFYTRTSAPASFADRLQLRMSTNGASSNAGATATSVGDFTTLLLDINPTLVAANYPSTWTLYTVTISGLAGPTSGKLAFRYFVNDGGPGGSNSDFIGIDDFTYTPFGTPVAGNVTASNPIKKYTLIPLSQVTPIPLTATIGNVGTAATTTAVLTVNVYKLPNLATPVQSSSSAPLTIAMGGQSVQNFGNFTPTTAGNYVINYVSSCTGNTITSADTAKYAFTITSNTYARDNGQTAGTYGIGSGPAGYIGTMYDITTITTLDSVLIALIKPGSDNTPHDAIGDSTRITVFNVVSGLPSAIIGKSAPYIFTPADTGAFVISTHAISAIGGGDLILNPGKYYVAVTEYNTNVGIAYSNDVFNLNSYYVSWPSQAWAPVETFGAAFSKAVIIRPIINDCIYTTSTSTVSLCSGSNHTYGDGFSATNITSNQSHVYTIPNALGCDSVITEMVTIKLNTSSTKSTNVCSGSGHTYGNGVSITNVTANQSLVYTIPNAAGCDSVITEMVVVKYNTSATVTSNVCSGSNHTYGNGTVVTNVVANESLVYTIPSAAGCDSVVTEMLVVKFNTSATITSNVCFGANHTYGNGTVATNLVANASLVYTIPSAAGCDSVVTEMVVVSTPLDLTITKVGTTLKSNAPGATYQWIDCGNGNAPIASQTSQSFTPTVNGNYAVIVTAGGCSDTSACETVTVTGINKLDLTSMEIYPNPTKDVVNVVMKNTEVANYTVLTVDGKLVMTGSSTSSTFSVDLSQYPNGIYLLNIEQNSLTGTYRLVKE